MLEYHACIVITCPLRVQLHETRFVFWNQDDIAYRSFMIGLEKTERTCEHAMREHEMSPYHKMLFLRKSFKKNKTKENCGHVFNYIIIIKLFNIKLQII